MSGVLGCEVRCSKLGVYRMSRSEQQAKNYANLYSHRRATRCGGRGDCRCRPPKTPSTDVHGRTVRQRVSVREPPRAAIHGRLLPHSPASYQSAGAVNGRPAGRERGPSASHSILLWPKRPLHQSLSPALEMAAQVFSARLKQDADRESESTMLSLTATSVWKKQTAIASVQCSANATVAIQ